MSPLILLADDSPSIRRVVELSLGDSTIRVASVRTGAEAWREFGSARPDLVLADTVMPEPDGYELCRRIKRSSRPVPVLLLSGTFDQFDPARARECGADGHLRKPFDAEALRRSVGRFLELPPSPVPSGDAPQWSPDALDALARAVVARLGEGALRELAAELLPEIAERVVRERIRQLERLDDNDATGRDRRDGPSLRGV